MAITLMAAAWSGLTEPALAETAGAKTAKDTAAARATDSRSAVYRFYNANTGAHFFTISAAERDSVAANLKQFRYEGPVFYAYTQPASDRSPVYRFYNTQTNAHFYTIDAAERDYVIATFNQFNYEGPVWYARKDSGDGATPLYRFYRTSNNAHFYTMDSTERDAIRASMPDFKYEGPVYSVWATGPSAPPLYYVSNPPGPSGVGADGSDNTWLKLDPQMVSLNLFQGESPTIKIQGTSSKTIAEIVNIRIVANEPVITTDVKLEASGVLQYTATMRVSPGLAPGTYSGTLSLYLCRDNPTVCASPYPGSPWQVAYQFNVASTTNNQSPIRKLAGAGSWSTYQGNPRHTGFVPTQETLDPANFQRRWRSLDNSYPYMDDSAVAIENGRIFYYSSGSGLIKAISEADGSQLWSSKIGSPRVIPIAVSDGSVYTVGEANEVYSFRRLDATTGVELARQIRKSNGIASIVPSGGGIYAATEGLTKWDAKSLAFQWLATPDPASGWKATVDSQYVYHYDESSNNISGVSASDGSLLFSSPLPMPSTRQFGSGTVIPAGPDRLIASFIASAYSSINGYSPSKKVFEWTEQGNFVSAPVIADNVLYILNVNGAESKTANVEARSPDSGKVLWTVPVPWSQVTTPTSANSSEVSYFMIGVGDFLFISSKRSKNEFTYAIDKRTRQIVWRYPFSGQLAVSDNGILYIVSSFDSGILAFNLH